MCIRDRANTDVKTVSALAPSCDRTPEELLYSIRSAMDMQDINQLAKHYHWPGITDARAEKILTQLEDLLKNPIVDIQLLYPYAPDQVQPQLLTQADNTENMSNADQPKQRPTPYALKIIQFQSDTKTQTHIFKLQQHFECWWIRY
jgi:hypothetical protein